MASQHERWSYKEGSVQVETELLTDLQPVPVDAKVRQSVEVTNHRLEHYAVSWRSTPRNPLEYDVPKCSEWRAGFVIGPREPRAARDIREAILRNTGTSIELAGIGGVEIRLRLQHVAPGFMLPDLGLDGSGPSYAATLTVPIIPLS
jgi:hypothetical protein